MSLLTPFLKLFKWDTTNETDLNSEFDIDKSMNDNLDKIDNFAGQANNVVIDIQDDIESIQAKDTEQDKKISTIDENISSIQNEQKTQNKSIEANTTKNTEQDKLIQKLQSNMINESTEEATSLHIEDASDLPAKLSIRGNHYQQTQEGTDNLAVLNEGSITQDGITVDVADGVASFSGVNTSDTITYITVGTAYLYAGKTYYLNVDRNQSSGASGFSLKNGTTISWFTVGTEKAYECTKTGEYEVRVSFGPSSVQNIGTFKALVSKTSGAEWVQGKKAIPSIEYPSEIETVGDYGQGSVEIKKINKNLFKLNDSNLNGVELTNLDDGSYKLNGTSLNSWVYRKGEPFVIREGIYTISAEGLEGLTSAVFGIMTEDNSFKEEINVSTTSKSFEIKKNMKVISFFTCNYNAVYDNVIVKVQLEKSKVKTSWKKHEEKSYTLPIQQEMPEEDYFDLENNKEIHNYEKKNMSNLEWQISTNQLQEKTFDFVVMFSNEELLSTEINCFSNSFKSETASYLNSNDEEGIGQSKSQIICRIGKEKVADLNAFKTLLAEKNAVVYVKTRSELDLTEEQKEVLQQLNNLELFKRVNNIYTEQNLALLKLDYTADTKIYIDNKIASQNKEILNVAGGN